MSVLSERKIDIAKPQWTQRERWQMTWHYWLTPGWAVVVFATGLVPRNVVFGVLIVAWLWGTWLMSNSVLWYSKFVDCVANAWAEAAKQLVNDAYEAGRQAGRDEATRDDKPWLH